MAETVRIFVGTCWLGSKGFYIATAIFEYFTNQPVIARARYKGYQLVVANATIISTCSTATDT